VLQLVIAMHVFADWRICVLSFDKVLWEMFPYNGRAQNSHFLQGERKARSDCSCSQGSLKKHSLLFGGVPKKALDEMLSQKKTIKSGSSAEALG
jgi:hypothetical protein